MAHFLRDQQVSNVSITSDGLAQISAVFADRAEMLKESSSGKDSPLVSYIIRFDNKGYRIFTLDELLWQFNQAKEVERVIFSVETGESVRTNRLIGAFVELRLDERDPNTCFLSVSSDDKDWVDSSFSAVQESLTKYKNRNAWVRTAWTMFGVQTVGVILGFILSLWMASKIAPRLAIANSFVLSFLFVLLLFSNTWTFLSQQIMRMMNFAFPNIKFLRHDKERLQWLYQAVVGGIVVAIVLYLLGQAFAFLLDILGVLVNKTA